MIQFWRKKNRLPKRHNEFNKSKNADHHRKLAGKHFKDFLLANFKRSFVRRDQLFGFRFTKQRFVIEDLLHRAKSELQEAIRLYPNDSEAFLKLSHVYCVMNDDKNRERALREAIRIKPDSYWHNLSLADVLMERKKFNDARRFFEKALNSASSPYEERIAHFWFGVMFLRADDYAQCDAEWQKIFPKYRNGMHVNRISPDDPETWEENWFGGHFELRDEHSNLLETTS